MHKTNQRILAAFKRSGLPEPLFCERLGFNDYTLKGWFRPDEAKGNKPEAPESAARLAEAHFPAGSKCPVCHNPITREASHAKP